MLAAPLATADGSIASTPPTDGPRLVPLREGEAVVERMESDRSRFTKAIDYQLAVAGAVLAALFSVIGAVLYGSASVPLLAAVTILGIPFALSVVLGALFHVVARRTYRTWVYLTDRRVIVENFPLSRGAATSEYADIASVDEVVLYANWASRRARICWLLLIPRTATPGLRQIARQGRRIPGLVVLRALRTEDATRLRALLLGRKPAGSGEPALGS